MQGTGEAPSEVSCPLTPPSHWPGVELASGLHAFLQERCNSSVAWEATGGNQLDTRCLQLTAVAAAADARPLYRGRSVPYHYYQNAVTPRHGTFLARQSMCIL